MAHNQFGYIQQCSKPLIYVNNQERLQPGLVNQCFVPNQYKLVDKVLCGNGFTTSFLKIQPTFSNQCNIIIVPNRQVILDKQKQYNLGLINTKNRIGFIYGETENGIYHSDQVDFQIYDVLMFVADSFINKLDLIKANENRIEKVLIDEAHSILIQSTFRYKLKGFIPLVKNVLPGSAIVAVTATPLLSQRADIIINSTLIYKRSINVSENQKKCFERAKMLIDQGQNVIIASNNSRLISRFANGGILNANFKIGKTLKGSLVELAKLQQNDDSKLTILSSSGFEGFDVNNGKNHVFIFEDRSRDEQTFFAANIIQIIGRSRNGTHSIWWCRNTHSEGRKSYKINDVLNKLLSRKIPIEKKVSDKNYKLLKDFSYQSKSKLLSEGQFLLSFDNIKWQLYNEIQLADNSGINVNADLFNKRGFDINLINEGNSRLPNTKTPGTKKEKFILLNRDYIKAYNVYNGLYCEVSEFKKTREAKEHLKQYLRRKYWDVNPGDLKYTNSENVALEFLSNQTLFNDFSKEIFNNYRKYKRQKEGSATKDYLEKIKKLEENIQSILIRLILMFVNEKVSLPKKERVWRDYSLVSEVSIKVIEFVSNAFYKKMLEIDIRNCNSRIIYAVCGVPFPKDFYGKNKENKNKINTILNLLWYDSRSRTKLDKSAQRKKRVYQLKQLGFNGRVIDFLINKFFEKDKSALFNFCSYHEMRIIDQLKTDLKNSITEEKNIGFIRRHDSIIVFGDFIPPKNVLNDFEYLGQKGWFIAA